MQNPSYETTRLQVRLTITTALDQALKKRAAIEKVHLRDVIHRALVEYVARPVVPERQSLKEAA